MTTSKNTKAIKAAKNEIAAAAQAGRVMRTQCRSYTEDGYTDAQRRNTLADMRGVVLYINKAAKVAHLTTTYDMAVMPLEAVAKRSFRDLAKQKTIVPVVPQNVDDFVVMRTGLIYSVTDAQGAKGKLYDMLQASGFVLVGKRAANNATMPATFAEIERLHGDAVALFAELPEQVAQDASDAEMLQA